jgi:DNA-binding PucR family transcriptional regulator
LFICCLARQEITRNSPKLRHLFDSKIPFLIQSLQTFIPLNNCIIYKTSLVVFINDSLCNVLLNAKKFELIEYFKGNSLFAGVSLSFTKLSESRKYYLQAQEASKLGQRYNLHLSHYEKCTNFIIADLISKNYDVIDFCHPAVIQLANDDKVNNTDFLQTLKYYLYFTNAPGKAAEVLCIHKNTLFYRINIIKQLTGINLDNIEKILQIYVSIKLLEINKNI